MSTIRTSLTPQHTRTGSAAPTAYQQHTASPYQQGGGGGQSPFTAAGGGAGAQRNQQGQRRNFNSALGGIHSSPRSSDPNSTSQPLIPLPPPEMSCHALLSIHLDDYISLVDQLFESFDPSLTPSAPPITTTTSTTIAAAATAAASAAHSTENVMTRLIRKDQLLQEAVAKLLAHQALHRSIQAKWAEVHALDAQLVAFCSSLGRLEHDLFLASSSESDGLVRGLGGAALKQQSFRARDVTLFSEKLARMSFAPADHIERKTALAEVTRPPAPLEKLMAGSMLHLNAEELEKLLEAEEQAKAREAAAQKDKALSLDHSAMMSDIDHHITSHMPGSLAALGRQESLTSTSTAATLPSFAELAQGAASGASTSSTQPPQLWRQESAHRHIPTTAPVALDLDLESSDDDEEEDE